MRMSNSSKSDFPIFTDQPELVYLDSAATALKPQIVIDAVTEYYEQYSANIHRGIYPMSEKATEAYEQAREQVANLLHAKSDEVIFTSGTTAGLNQVASSYQDILTDTDEVIVPRSEHHANLLPWQRLTAKTDSKLVIIDHRDLTPQRITQHINADTSVLAFAHVSNVLGTINDVAGIATAVRKVNKNVVIVVDGAQAVPHLDVDVPVLGVDYYAFSGHKIYGPTGIGALWVNETRMDELQPLTVGGGAISTVTDTNYKLLKGPQGFEAGTPPIAEAIGMGMAAEYLQEENREKITDNKLATTLYDKLSKLEFVNVIGGEQGNRIPLATFTVRNVHAHDVAQFLADRNICVRAGHHCTMPLHTKLNISASVRASLGVYNTNKDIDKLVETLKACYAQLSPEKQYIP